MSLFPRAALSPTERASVEAKLYEHAHALLKLGIHLELTADFRQLQAANAVACRRGGVPLLPLLNPDRTTLGADNAFALIGRRDGMPVCTIAAVIRHVAVGLQDALEDLSLLYDPPALAEATDAWCEVDADDLNDIRGKIMMLGTLWRDPDLKQAGSTEIGDHIFALAILHGLKLHKPNFAAGIIAGETVEWLGYDKEHFRRFHHGLRYVDPAWGYTTETDRLVLVTMSRARMKAMFLGLPAI
ncbi:hypothetical protein GCM10011611_39090 [Aliidongia dinghuensis]|uniref:Uncharacterized protein n=1 Tax=Aliidongia dinghuensis TaxID=1867774 RepID=A0A8J2YVW8_9PROT|nr:hypothetical protein [Aliidongia dinghuensis]GGF29249.1 hypothetical protein GCM10011611_39090 [Aliidongia dinghuensis]